MDPSLYIYTLVLTFSIYLFTQSVPGRVRLVKYNTWHSYIYKRLFCCHKKSVGQSIDQCLVRYDNTACRDSLRGTRTAETRTFLLPELFVGWCFIGKVLRVVPGQGAHEGYIHTDSEVPVWGETEFWVSWGCTRRDETRLDVFRISIYITACA